jgi:NADH-quinone oxidoreductase subunit H
VVPYVELHKKAELDAGVLYLLSVTSFATVALVTGGHDAGPKASFLDYLRAFVRAIVCEVPAAIAIGAVVLSAGSFRLRDLAAGQLGPGGSVFETGAWPWYFNAVRSPQLLVLFLAFFVTVLVEPTRVRALHGADDGRSGGLGSLRRSAFFFAEWMNVFIMCALASALFFGAWFVPGFSAAEHESNGALALLGTALYLGKSWLLVAVVMTKRVSLPRVRSDVLLGLGLKYGLPVALLCVGLTVIETLYPPVPTVAVIVSGVTLATAVAILALFVGGFFRGDRSRGERTTASAIL